MKIKQSVVLCFSVLVLSFGCTPAVAEYHPGRLSRSVVKVLVKDQLGVSSVATGFLWQRADLVVTSLHLMNTKSNAKVIVEFGKIKRHGKVVSVLSGADLVLLKVNRVVSGWYPIYRYSPDKPPYKAPLYALGYHRGASGLSSRELRKGYVEPELLSNLLPPDAVEKLRQAAVINVDLPIYYLEGSLLPGFSGAPVVDDQGVLVGIGNGGIRKGAASVSWVIPARYLNQLIRSDVSQLPAKLEDVNEVFFGDFIDLKGSALRFK